MKTLGEAIQQFLKAQGLLARRGKEDLTAAWREAAGEAVAGHSRVCAPRKGVLRIEIDSAPLLHELNSFRRGELLAAMQRLCPRAALVEIRFAPNSKVVGPE